MLIGWDVGVLIYLVAAAVVMTRCSSASAMQSNAAAQDEGGFAILILSVAAAIASLGAIFAELATIERTNPSYGLYVALAIGTVVLSWCFTHTIFALHYAHGFYGEHLRKSGLKFPGESQPDYWDFIYFAFRHRHDVPGFGCGHHQQVDTANGRRSRRAVVFLHRRHYFSDGEHRSQCHSEIS
jgi:uncharacterized membrane protein